MQWRASRLHPSSLLGVERHQPRRLFRRRAAFRQRLRPYHYLSHRLRYQHHSNPQQLHSYLLPRRERRVHSRRLRRQQPLSVGSTTLSTKAPELSSGEVRASLDTSPSQMDAHRSNFNGLTRVTLVWQFALISRTAMARSQRPVICRGPARVDQGRSRRHSAQGHTSYLLRPAASTL